jgi:hypothetical protein
LKTRDFISDDTTANMWSEYLLPGWVYKLLATVPENQ